MLIPLTRAKGSGLTTLKVEYIDDLPEYPATHIHGYTYVIASRGRTQVEMEHLPDDVSTCLSSTWELVSKHFQIQYAKRQPFGRKRPVYCPFFQCQVKKWTWKCSGIYACEFLNPFLQSYHHTSVDDKTWQEIQKSQRDIQILESDIRKRNAYRYSTTCQLVNKYLPTFPSYYRSKISFFKKGLACIDQLPTCKAVFKRYNQMVCIKHFSSGREVVNKYLGCSWRICAVYWLYKRVVRRFNKASSGHNPRAYSYRPAVPRGSF
jgi:hypothetical protein